MSGLSRLWAGGQDQVGQGDGRHKIAARRPDVDRVARGAAIDGRLVTVSW